MKFIIGKKLSMTQRFLADGAVVPVTLVSVGPCTVTAVKTPIKDGYAAVQIGYGPRRKIAKPQLGQLRGLPSFGTMKEFRLTDVPDIVRGQVITASVFTPGDVVLVQGVSKGRGFQGVVKRHGFAGHPTSHGHKDQTRMPGSIGSKRQGPVAPGKRMAGRMGGDQVTVKNLDVVAVDAEKNILAIKGAVPGSRGSILLLSGPGLMELAPVTQTDQESALAASPESGDAVSGNEENSAV